MFFESPCPRSMKRSISLADSILLKVSQAVNTRFKRLSLVMICVVIANTSRSVHSRKYRPGQPAEKPAFGSYPIPGSSYYNLRFLYSSTASLMSRSIISFILISFATHISLNCRCSLSGTFLTNTFFMPSC